MSAFREFLSIYGLMVAIVAFFAVALGGPLLAAHLIFGTVDAPLWWTFPTLLWVLACIAFATTTVMRYFE